MIEKGSMITIDYTASIVEKDSKRVFDTTLLEVATKETIYQPNKIYEPMLVVLGKEWIPKGLNQVLENADIGQKLEVIIPCEDAYGPKDPSKIKLVARREFQKMNINPSIGDRVVIGNQEGTVVSVNAARVRMDYNHILAGKNIQYKIQIHDEILGEELKIEHLIKRRLPGADLTKIRVEVKEDIINVYLPEQTRYYEYVQFAKAEVAKDISEILPHYTGIKFVDFFSL